MMNANDNTAADLSKLQPDELANALASQRALRAKPYRWPDPSTLPRRQWMLGEWLLAGEVTAIIAPGGTGKSTLSASIALSLASGRALLGQQPKRTRGVWIYNLEDSLEEVEKQVSAALLHHGIARSECGDRIHLNSGLDSPLCVAIEEGGKAQINEEAFVELAATIRENDIGAVVVDPLISSHRLSEASNEGIDLMVKRWKRLAYETGCAVMLVHHTKKLGGRDATAEDGRGAVALRDAARIVMVLNKLGVVEADACGITDGRIRKAIVKIELGKASRSSGSEDVWVKLVGHDIGNGNDDGSEPSDNVAVAIPFDRPDAFDGVTTYHLYKIQQRLDDNGWRQNHQAADWVGKLIAEELGLDPELDGARLKKLQASWTATGAFKVVRRKLEKGSKDAPFIVTGNPVAFAEIGPSALRATSLR